MPRIRARDVQPLIKEHGFEQGVVQILVRALEEQSEIRLHMQEVVKLAAQCVDELEKLIHVGDGLRNQLEELKRTRQQGDDQGAGIGWCGGAVLEGSWFCCWRATLRKNSIEMPPF